MIKFVCNEVEITEAVRLFDSRQEPELSATSRPQRLWRPLRLLRNGQRNASPRTQNVTF